MTAAQRGTPWAQVPADVARRINESLGASAFYVYTILRSFYDPKRPERCWPSQEAIAERAGVTVRTVQRHLEALEREGFIRRDRRCGTAGRGRISDGYAFLDGLTNPTTGVALVADQHDTRCQVGTPDQGDSRCQVSPGPRRQSEDDQGDNPGTTNTTTGVACDTKDEQTSTRPVTDHHPPYPPAASESLPAALAEFGDAGVVAVVFDYGNDNGLADRAWRTLLGQLRHAATTHGAEAARRALADLASALRNGQQPGDPQKLPNYFAPILKRAVQNWKREERERAAEAEREKARREHAERLEREGEQAQSGERPALFERFRGPRRPEAPVDEAAQRARLQEQARLLAASGGSG